MATYHPLDINPIPEKVLYINGTGMIDATIYNESFDDNPLADAIMDRIVYDAYKVGWLSPHRTGGSAAT